MHSYQTSKNNQHIKNVMQRDRKLTIPSKVRTCSSTRKKKNIQKTESNLPFIQHPPPHPQKKRKKATDGNFFAMHVFPIMHNVIQDIH